MTRVPTRVRSTLIASLAATALVLPMAAFGGTAAADETSENPATTEIDLDLAKAALANFTDGSVRTVSLPESVGKFTSIAPARVFDSRNNKGNLVEVPTRKVKPGEEIKVNFADLGVFSEDEEPMAVALNLTVVDSDLGSYAVAYPCGSKPTTSTVNIEAKKTFANSAIIAVTDDDLNPVDVCFAVDKPMNVVVDITGYFSVTAAEASTFVPIEPARIFDSRGSGDSLMKIDSGKRKSNDIIEVPFSTLDIFEDGHTPTAIDLRLTTTESDTDGYAVAYPCAQGVPNSSTVNLSLTEDMTNAGIIPLDKDGKICVSFVGVTHALMDVSGYYTAGSDGYQFIPIPPTRGLDTRPGFPPDSNEELPITNEGTYRLDFGEAPTEDERPRAVAANVTTVNATGPGYLRNWGPQRKEPATSMNNYPGGPEARASSAILELGEYKGKDGWTFFSTPQVTDLIVDVTGFFY